MILCECAIGYEGDHGIRKNPRNHRENRAPVAQFVERRAVTREVAGSNPGRINTQNLKIIEEKVLPL